MIVAELSGSGIPELLEGPTPLLDRPPEGFLAYIAAACGGSSCIATWLDASSIVVTWFNPS
jgi:hypothetical protein